MSEQAGSPTRAVVRRRIALVALVSLMFLAGCSASSGLDSRTGVSVAPSGEVELHYALCPGEHINLVRTEELVGGNRTEYGVPIYWQIESEGAALPDPVVVGSVPDGWTETVRYGGSLPDDDLVGIEGTRDGMGMSFRLAALREGEVLRGTYDTVSLERFETDAEAQCRDVRRGAFLAGLLAPLVAAGALAMLWRLHRAQPTSWSSRQARRGWAWVVAVCAGSFWTLTLFAAQNYQSNVVEIALYAGLAAIPAVPIGLLVLPLAGGVGWLGHRFIPAAGQRWSAVGCAIGAGAIFWLTLCGGDWRWLPLSAAMSLGLAAMIPADELRLHLPEGRPVKALAVAMVAGCCVVSAFGTVASLSNSPTPPRWDLADYRPADDLDPPVANGVRVLLEERRAGSDEMSFDAEPGYRLLVACDAGGIQLSGGLRRESVSYGDREVVPCGVGEIAGPLGGRVHSGERMFVKVVAPPGVEWHIIATAAE